MPIRYSASSAPIVAGPQSISLSPSAGDGSGLAIYHEHTQTIAGSWRRVWKYNDPVPGSSGPPTVAYSFCEVFVDESVVQKFMTADFSGTFQQMHDIDYWSDSSEGGWGTSGLFYSSKAGIIRKLKAATDTQDTCVKSYTTNAAVQMGQYEPTLDTSANFNSQFLNDILTEAQNKCPRFDLHIVTI